MAIFEASHFATTFSCRWQTYTPNIDSNLESIIFSTTWWHKLLILALGRLRPEDCKLVWGQLVWHSKFYNSLGYTIISSLEKREGRREKWREGRREGKKINLFHSSANFYKSKLQMCNMLYPVVICATSSSIALTHVRNANLQTPATLPQSGSLKKVGPAICLTMSSIWCLPGEMEEGQGAQCFWDSQQGEDKGERFLNRKTCWGDSSITKVPAT